MIKTDRTPSIEKSLVDLPLQKDPGGLFEPAAELPSDAAPASAPAPLSPRVTAFAADSALTLFTTALALLAATRLAHRAVMIPAFVWAAVFVVYLSFFATTVPLALFGRTLGMSLAGLAARPSPSGRRLTLGEASVRWLGTLWTGASLGLALLTRNPGDSARTPADRFSRRALVEAGDAEEIGSRE